MIYGVFNECFHRFSHYATYKACVLDYYYVAIVIYQLSTCLINCTVNCIIRAAKISSLLEVSCFIIINGLWCVVCELGWLEGISCYRHIAVAWLRTNALKSMLSFTCSLIATGITVTSQTQVPAAAISFELWLGSGTIFSTLVHLYFLQFRCRTNGKK